GDVAGAGLVDGGGIVVAVDGRGFVACRRALGNGRAVAVAFLVEAGGVAVAGLGNVTGVGITVLRQADTVGQAALDQAADIAVDVLVGQHLVGVAVLADIHVVEVADLGDGGGVRGGGAEIGLDLLDRGDIAVGQGVESEAGDGSKRQGSKFIDVHTHTRLQ